MAAAETANSWTLVYLPSPFSPHFQPTGIYGTWDELAEDTYRTEALQNAHAVYLVPATATEQTSETGRVLKIAPTKEQKAAAKARQAKIDAILAKHHDGLHTNRWSPVMGFGGRIGANTPEEVAAYAADNGMTYEDISRTQW